MSSSINISKKIKKESRIMKTSLILLALAIIIPTIAISQTTNGIGVKAGFNYNSNGDYIEFANKNIITSDRKIGYHMGLFGKFGTDIYFRPELVYSVTKSEYENDGFKMQKLDAPFLLGYKVLSHLSVFGGPSFQYILNSKFDNITIKDIDNNFSVGVNMGIGINLNKWGIDLRYERGFSDDEARILSKNGIDTNRLYTRPDQFILSVSVLL